MSGDSDVSGEYGGVEYRNIQFSRKKLPFHLKDHFAYGKKLRRVMDELRIEEDAHVFVYSMYRDLVKTALKKTEAPESGAFKHSNGGVVSAVSVSVWKTEP